MPLYKSKNKRGQRRSGMVLAYPSDTIVLNDKAWGKLEEILENPGKPTPELKELMADVAKEQPTVPMARVSLVDYRFPTGYREPLELTEGKGVFGKNCNVTACQLADSAFFYNRGTRKYYCYHCAKDIADSNPGAILFDRPLLRKVIEQNTDAFVSELTQEELIKSADVLKSIEGNWGN